MDNNNIIMNYASQFMITYDRLFPDAENDVCPNTAILKDVEMFFNANHVLISLITGTSLEPIQFDHTYPDCGLNKCKFRHVFSMLYNARMHFYRIRGNLGFPRLAEPN